MDITIKNGLEIATYATDRTFFAFSCPTMNWFKYRTSYAVPMSTHVIRSCTVSVPRAEWLNHKLADAFLHSWCLVVDNPSTVGSGGVG